MGYLKTGSTGNPIVDHIPKVKPTGENLGLKAKIFFSSLKQYFSTQRISKTSGQHYH